MLHASWSTLLCWPIPKCLNQWHSATALSEDKVGPRGRREFCLKTTQNITIVTDSCITLLFLMLHGTWHVHFTTHVFACMQKFLLQWVLFSPHLAHQLVPHSWPVTHILLLCPTLKPLEAACCHSTIVQNTLVLIYQQSWICRDLALSRIQTNNLHLWGVSKKGVFLAPVCPDDEIGLKSETLASKSWHYSQSQPLQWYCCSSASDHKSFSGYLRYLRV